MDFKNISHKEPLQVTRNSLKEQLLWVANKEETEVTCSHVSVAALCAGVASQPGTRV